MLSSKERLEKLEKDHETLKDDYEALLGAVEQIERDKAIKKEVERVLTNEKSGLFKYFLEIIKIGAGIILILISGDKAIQSHPWIAEIFK
jgi:hypothetical protein